MKTEALTVPVEFDGDGIAGDAGLGASQQPFLAKQPIDEGRLAGVRAAYHGDADRACRSLGGIARVVLLSTGLRINLGCVGQRGAERGIEISQSLAVLRRDCDRLAETKLVAFEHTRLRGSGLALVRDDDGRLARSAHQIGKRAHGKTSLARKFTHTVVLAKTIS